MTPEKQRIAIAEACGWMNTHCTAGLPCGIAPRELQHRQVPDYLNDLNAMHAAEKTLDNGVLWRGYLNRLWEVVCPERNQMNGLDAATGLLLVHATAARRAEAFLKTLGLWEET